MPTPTGPSARTAKKNANVLNNPQQNQESPIYTPTVAATAALGSVTVEGDAIVPAAGLSTTGSVGGVSVGANAVVTVAGLSADAETTPVLARGNARVFVGGLSAQGLVGDPLVWGRVVPDAGTFWTEIAA